MKPQTEAARSNAAEDNPELGFRKAILRLVSGGAERRAIETGQVDAIVDPASGAAILLPEAQKALLQRNQSREQLARLACDGYWEQDRDFRFVSHTGGLEGEDSAFDLANTLGRALWDLPVENLSDVDWQTHRQQLAWHATFRDLEVRWVAGNGKIRCLALSGEPIYDPQDQFCGYRGVVREITPRRQFELASRAHYHLARLGFDGLVAPACVLDAQGQIVLVNRAWRRIASEPGGLFRALHPGANLLMACDTAEGDAALDGHAIAAGVRQVIAAERLHLRYEYRGPAAASGRSTQWFALDVVAIAGDGTEGALISLEDLSERRQARRMRALELQTALCLAQAGSAAEGAVGVIQLCCESLGWECGRQFGFDPAGRVLQQCASWGIPVTAVTRFLERSRDLSFRADVGLAERVVQSGQTLWVREDSSDPLVARTGTSTDTAAGGALVFPVSADDQVLGMLAFSCGAGQAPDDLLLQAMRCIGAQLGHFLRQAEVLQKLRRSEARFRRLTAIAADWHWEQGSDFRFTCMEGSSPFGTRKVLGLASWELLGQATEDASWIRHRAELSAHLPFCDFEFTVRHADGRRTRHAVSGEPVFGEDGAFAGYCGTGRDVR